MNSVEATSETSPFPVWGTQHPAGCYYGSGLYAVWYAVEGCPEPHPRAQSADNPPGGGFDQDGIKWCPSACPRCGFAMAADYTHVLEISGRGCFDGAFADVLQALEEPTDPGHLYRVARMIRMSPSRLGPPNYCIVLSCDQWRSRDGGWTCDPHKHLPRCATCELPTPAHYLIDGRCVGCFHLYRDTPS